MVFSSNWWGMVQVSEVSYGIIKQLVGNGAGKRS
jgi:hypothetical protein